MDGVAQVWDGATGQAIGLPLRHQLAVYFAAFSPDGHSVATASRDDTARIWNAATGEPCTPLLRHGAAIGHVAFSPDGQRLATASQDHTARVWDAATGKPITPPMQHNYYVHRAAFSPDGRLVATSSSDGTARLWDAAKGIPISPNFKHEDEVISIAFSPDGRWVLTASGDHTARLWDSLTGQPIFAPLRHNRWLFHAAFSPDGRRVVTVSHDRSVRVWDLPMGAPPVIPHESDKDDAITARDSQGKRMASLSEDGSATLWDVKTGQRLGKLPLNKGGYKLRFNQDGTKIVTVSHDHTLRVWDAATGQPLSPPLRHDQAVSLGFFSPKGRMIVTMTEDHLARLWDAETGQPLSPPMPCTPDLLAFESEERLRLDRQRVIALTPLREHPTSPGSDFTDEFTLEDLRTWVMLLQYGKPLDVAEAPQPADNMNQELNRLRTTHPGRFKAPSPSAAWHRSHVSEVLKHFRYVEQAESKARLTHAVTYHLERAERLEPGHVEGHWLGYCWAALLEDWPAAERHAQALLRLGPAEDANAWIYSLYQLYGLRSEVLAAAQRTPGWPTEHQAMIHIWIHTLEEQTSTLHRLAWSAVSQPGANPERLELALRQAQAAAAYQPHHPDIRMCLAFVHLRQAQIQEAYQAFLESTRLRQSYLMQDMGDVRQFGRELGLLFAHPFYIAETKLLSIDAAEAAGMAMALHRLGRMEEATLWLKAGQRKVAGYFPEKQPEPRRLLQEAESLIHGSK